MAFDYGNSTGGGTDLTQRTIFSVLEKVNFTWLKTSGTAGPETKTQQHSEEGLK